MRTLLLTISIVVTSSAIAQPAPELTGGNGTIYVGAFPSRVLVVDEATEQVVDEIRMELDGPPSDILLSQDKNRLYMRDRTFEHIEIIDLQDRTTLDTLTLSEGSTKVRIRDFVVSPDESYAVLLLDTATKQIDRFEIAPRKLVQLDLTTHEIVHEIAWPDGEERVSVNMLFSPDGNLLYLFGDEILALETESFTVASRWQLSRIEEPSLGGFNFRFRSDPNEEPGFYSGLFRVQDPAQNRRLMGIARINLAELEVDFYTLGPDEPLSSFALAPSREKAYAILRRIGHYEFWTFDLVGRRVEKRELIDGRPRMAFNPSTNGQLLYVHQAGATIDIYEAATYRYLRSIQLAGDMTNVLVVAN